MQETIRNVYILFYFNHFLSCTNKGVIIHDARSQNDLYLHKTKIPTMHFQPSLPRLPIPPLEKTCQRYLNAQLPLLDGDSMENTKKLVSDFLSGSGRG